MIGDLLGKVISKYEADASQHISELKKLKGEQLKASQEMIASQERVGKALDDWKVKAGIAMAGVGAAIAIAKVGFDEFSRTVKLQAGAAAIDIGRLDSAYDGLRTRTELLTLAQAGARGAFKLNTSEMEGVVKGMRALEAQGFEVAEVTQKITKAIQEGAVGQLEEFGIKLQSTGTIAGDKKAVLKALGDQVRAVGGDFDSAADGVTRAGVAWENTLHGVKMGIGELVAEMGPLLEGLGMAVGAIGEVVSAARKAKDVLGWVNPVGLGGRAAAAAAGAAGDALFSSESYSLYPIVAQAYTQRLDEAADSRDFIDAQNRANALRQQRAAFRGAAGQTLGVGRIQSFIREIGIGLGLEDGFRAPKAKAGPAKWAYDGGAPFGLFEQLFSAGGDALGNLGYGLGQANDRFNAEYEGNRNRRLAASEAQSQAAFGSQAAQSILADMAKMRGERRNSILEQVFGAPSEIDATAEALSAASSSVSVFTGAMQAGMDAWITGAASFGKAFKTAIAEGLRGLSSEFLGQSLRHGLFALGSLAFGDVAGASKHGIAAAAFGAGAITVGALAKGLGAGQVPSAGAGAGGYRSAGGGTSAGAGGSRTINVVIGSGGEESPRENRRRVSRALFMAEQQGYAARPPGVQFS